MVRYRTEDYSGSGIRTAVEVMAFEIFELSNIDILKTLLDSQLLNKQPITDPTVWGDGSYYKSLLSSDWWRMPTAEKAVCVMDEIEENGGIDDMSEDDRAAFIRELLTSIKASTGYDVRYALWLADEKVVRDYYGAENIDAYETGPVVLSDLGHDGTLYGYEHQISTRKRGII